MKEIRCRWKRSFIWMPVILAELLEQFGSGPMAAEAINAAAQARQTLNGQPSATMAAGVNKAAWTTPHPICLKNYAAITNRNSVCSATSLTDSAESTPGPPRG
ncbi:hypothetical protein F3J20_24405 [Paraburkholderia sp. Cy-641]|nr:hypothetical protein [Paraburkholderia sp. Cy-641]